MASGSVGKMTRTDGERVWVTAKTRKKMSEMRNNARG